MKTSYSKSPWCLPRHCYLALAAESAKSLNSRLTELPPEAIAVLVVVARDPQAAVVFTRTPDEAALLQATAAMLALVWLWEGIPHRFESGEKRVAAALDYRVRGIVEKMDRAGALVGEEALKLVSAEHVKSVQNAMEEVRAFHENLERVAPVVYQTKSPTVKEPSLQIVPKLQGAKVVAAKLGWSELMTSIDAWIADAKKRISASFAAEAKDGGAHE